MKYKISISVTESHFGIRKNQLCDMINRVHSDDYTYSQISFKIRDINIFGIIANDYFQKYNFNLNELEQELSILVQHIINNPSSTFCLEMKDKTPLNVYMVNLSEPLSYPVPATSIEEESEIPF